LNYLAHALLAQPHPLSLIGNVAGDLIKGRIEDHDLHPRVADGVRWHRRVDALTDAHPRYRALIGGFPEPLRRVAPIVLDVLFDHYLWRTWPRVARRDRDAFLGYVYATLSAEDAPLPEALRERAPAWVAADWLRVYRTREGVEAVVQRLARRARRPLPLVEALRATEDRDVALEAGFVEVFCDVRDALADPAQGPLGHPVE